MTYPDLPETGGWVYFMGSMSGVLYVGSTGDLVRRVWEYKERMNEGSFTSRYNVMKLLYFESFEELYLARDREYIIKKWSRQKKLDLIQTQNPLHLDLANDWFD